MSKILGSIKSIFGSKKAPKYKNYSDSELKIVAMKTRMILEQIYKKCAMKIHQCDSQLIQVVQNSGQNISKSTMQLHYGLLQQIGKKVVQVESIKIYMQILKKIQANAQYLINTNGDISKMKQQVRWFQCILWYRKCHQLKNLQDIYQFCFNFFKGLDITTQINVKCEIFQIYPILKYLSNNIVLPLEILMIDIIQYLTPKIPDEVIEQVYKINHHQLKKWINLQKKQATNRSVSKSPRNISFSPSPRRKHEQLSSKSQVYNINQKKSEQQQIKTYLSKSKSIGEQEREMIKIRQELLQKQQQKQRQIKQQRQRQRQIQLQRQRQRQQLQKKKQNQKSMNPFISFGKQQNGQQEDFLNSSSSMEMKPKVSLSRLFSNKSLSSNSSQIKGRPNSNLLQQKGQIASQSQKNIKQIKNNEEKDSPIIKKVSLSRLFSQGKQMQKQKQMSDVNVNANEASIEQVVNQNEDNQPFKEEHIHSNQKVDQHDENEIDQQISQQNQFNNTVSKQIQQFKLQLEHQTYLDEQQSLSFIRASIQITKKGIKKPYMVSIYGRQQYVNMKK